MRARLQSLSWLGLLFVVLGVLLPARPAAAAVNSLADALAGCNKARSDYGLSKPCTFFAGPNSKPYLAAGCYGYFTGRTADDWGFGTPYCGALNWGDTACVNAAYPSVKMYLGGKILSGYTLCARQEVESAPGQMVSCQRQIEPVSAPTLDPYSGLWQTYVSASSSAILCGSDADAGRIKDRAGEIQNPAGDPIVPPSTGDPSNGQAPPKVCGGGSCYDPGTDQFCATSGGAQICVPGSTARGAPGACVSTGDAALCSGSPSSPKPPPPPSSPISDPPSSIRSSDKTTQADKTTGQNQTVVTTVYAPPGVQVDNGAKPGDTTKPPDNWCVTDETGVKHCIPKTDPGTSYCVTLGDGSKVCEPKDGKENDKGTASGGQDCNSPPVCSGDAPTCAVVDQQWLSRCKAHFGEDASTGQPNWTKVSEGDGAQYATTDTPREAVIDDGSGSGEGTGPGAIDESGFAGNTCPILPSFEVFGQVVSFDQDLFCRWLSLLRSIFLVVAAFVAARILASGGKA